MAVASAGPYASLHIAPDRQPRQHLTTQFFTGRMPFLSPNQQRQSTEGIILIQYITLVLILISTNVHTRLTAPCPGLSRRASTRKVKPIGILLKQETVSGSGISWAICKSAHRSRQITTPAPHHSVFLQAGCPSCRPTNGVKALKAVSIEGISTNVM